MKKLRTLLRRKPLSVLRSEEGISAVEFALIAPLMAFIYLGSIELSFMMSLDRKVTSAASTLGDLVARDNDISDAELGQIIEATRMVIQPNDIAQARLRVSSLEDQACNGNIRVGWSDASGLTPEPVGKTVTVPASIVSSCGSVIFAEFEYDYVSPFGFFSSSRTLRDEFYLRPRRSEFVLRNGT